MMTARSCPLAEFLSFPANTKLYARLWLRDAEIHPAAHWIIRERLAGWAGRVASAPEEVRAKLAREAAPVGRPRPSATMPLRATGSLAGEQNAPARCPSTPTISDCAEAIAAPREIQISPPASPRRASGRRAYHRRAAPRGSGRWAQKCRLSTRW
jgi:hypothetical protein